MLFLCLNTDIHNLIYITELLTNTNLERNYRYEQKLFPENPTLTLQEFTTKAFRCSTEISPQAGEMRLPSFLNFKAWRHVALWRRKGTDPVHCCLLLQQIYFFRSSKKNFAHTQRWNSRIIRIHNAVFQCLGSQDFSDEWNSFSSPWGRHGFLSTYCKFSLLLLFV